MIDRSDQIALACHIPCELECVRLERELADAIADRDRYIARCKKLEDEREALRKILK